MEKKTMGSFIAVLRKAKGMTQKELAELLNVSDKAVSRWEREESMPDITLIPVLADIFGVSCDDLLRGEKVDREAFEETAEKRIHRMKILLKRSRSRFQAFSMISIGAVLIGFLFAVISNFIYHKATVGFYGALTGIIIGGTVQAVFYFYFKGEVDTEEIVSPELLDYRKYVRNHTLYIFYLLVILLGICLPLLVFGQISYADYIAAMSEAMAPEGFEAGTSADTGAVFPMGKIAIGLQLKTWMLYGGIGGFVSVILCFIVDNAVRYLDAGQGRFGVTAEDIKRHKKRMLRGAKYLVVLFVLLVFTAEGSRVFKENMPGHFVQGTQFGTYEAFKEHMETRPEDMAPGVVELRKQREKYYKVLYGDNEELLCEYLLLNDDVVKIEYGKNNKLPITTYTKEDYALAKKRWRT